MSRVLITSKVIGRCDVGVDILAEAGLEYELVTEGSPYSAEQMRSLVSEDCEAMIVGVDRIDASVMDAAPNLRIIARTGVGYDPIDVAAATERGIAVTITPGANSSAVADIAMALMLASARRITEIHGNSMKNEFANRPGFDMWQKTIGIIGFGNIGKGVAKRASGFDMRILVHDLAPDVGYAKEIGAEIMDIDTILKESDFVTLHVPATPETDKLIGERELSLMKPTAILVNTARGALIDEKALYDALKSGMIAAAGLDVAVVEPPKDNPLYELSNCILLPHVAANTESATVGMARMSAECVVSMLVDGKPLYAVNMD